MMVVIGLIAIVGAWAIPGLKKAYDSFKIAETFDHLDTFRSSFRAYYLIMNEFPEDGARSGSATYIPKNVAWCIPSSYYTRTLNWDGQQYKLKATPYRADVYDIDNWLGQIGYAQSQRQFFISLRGNKEEWLPRLQNRYGNASLYTASTGMTGIRFLEISVQVEGDPGTYNRFY